MDSIGGNLGYFMGLNLSNEHIGQALALNGSDVQQMTAPRREGVMYQLS